ncbi:hypothetical protein [Dyadobacter sediminis]|uniref:Uncharacterized protein n=1 Tax=Dyadobacter sediminis TaxID=1493691 RepID=A0A5R9KHU3_9BACT|nr:hypothetical protein [Dyadobacter sediminis]TLU95783.1 hypothetical protein FEM55_01080 [Dyadobacter sediminis]GGB76531.1 hypothetical protein GCM10011325_00030 [Dyadobacter sediminis]
MTLEENKALYEVSFPICGLGKRMSEQLERPLSHSGYGLPSLIFLFKLWYQTHEGCGFWTSIYDLYLNNHTISEEQVLKVFIEYNIVPFRFSMV